MLAVTSMGSHGGDYRPFGYDLDEVHGIGLPAFSVPGPPPSGPGILSDQEQEQMQDFFHRFDDSGLHGANMMHPYQNDISPIPGMPMPQTYVGHETSLRSPHNWHEMPMNNFQYNAAPMNHMQAIPPQGPSFPQQQQQQQQQQLPLGLYTEPVQYEQMAQPWQPPFVQHQPPIRPDMSFGTDPNFQNGSYHGPTPARNPSGPMSLTDLNLTISHTAPNSQPNTQPNTRPNTQPSSPVISKKRKQDDYHVDSNKRRNSLVQAGKQNSTPASHQKRKSLIKNERPPTPLSKPASTDDNVAREADDDDDDDADADADFDEDAEHDLSRSRTPPAPWPSSKARPPAGLVKSKKKQSLASNGTSKSKPRLGRTSSASNLLARVPLTAEQKKANHTNSEQRRRDATARAYAELYDLVPEVNDMGKQSTMKKLEVVVEKVRKVQARKDMLRAALGMSGSTGYSTGTLPTYSGSRPGSSWQ